MIPHDGYYDTYSSREPLLEENAFLRARSDDFVPPTFQQAWPALPRPFWDGREDVVACYRKAWELAFANLRRPEPGSGFVANFVDTAFNDCLFMWDSAFILLFIRTSEA